MFWWETAGLLKGLKQLRLRNWKRLPVDPRSVEAVSRPHSREHPSQRLLAVIRGRTASGKGLLQQRHQGPVRRSS